MPGTLPPSTRDPITDPHYWVTARGKRSVPMVTGGGKQERRGGKGPAESGSEGGRASPRYHTHLLVSSSRRALCSRRTEPSDDLGRTRERHRQATAQRPCPCTATQSWFCPRLCFQLPSGFLGDSIATPSGSQCLPPHIQGTYSQAGRIHPRRLHCPGLWAEGARGGTSPSPGLQAPQEPLCPTGCLAMSSESLTPTQAVVGGNGDTGECTGCPTQWSWGVL